MKHVTTCWTLMMWQQLLNCKKLRWLCGQLKASFLAKYRETCRATCKVQETHVTPDTCHASLPEIEVVTVATFPWRGDLRGNLVSNHGKTW